MGAAAMKRFSLPSQQIRDSSGRLDLLSLPPEIRDEIYRHVIPIDRLFILLLADSSPGQFDFDRGYGFPAFETSILRVCRKMHTEACAFWYRHAKFRIEFGGRLKYPNPERWPGPRWHISTNAVAEMVNIHLKVTMQLTTSDPGMEKQNCVVLENGRALRKHIDRLARTLESQKDLRVFEIEVVDQLRDGLAMYSLLKRDSHKYFLPMFKLVLRNLVGPLRTIGALDKVTLARGPFSEDMRLKDVAPLNEQEKQVMNGIFLKEIAFHEKTWAHPSVSCSSEGQEIFRVLGPALTCRAPSGGSYTLKISPPSGAPS